MSYRSRGGVQTNRGIQIADPRYALLFPMNLSGGDTSAPFVALQFLNPQNNGLPIWGPSNTGCTYIWEYSPSPSLIGPAFTVGPQTGYYVTFWWSNNGNFLWDGGSSNTYYGAHPYPQNSSNTGTSHWWEIGGGDSGADWTTTLAGTQKVVVKDGTIYLQALRVIHNGGTKTIRFYTQLPSLANGDIIQADVPTGFGNINPPSPALTFGDSPWFADFQHERMGGYFGRSKIFNVLLSESDMLSEALDMPRLVTSAGSSAIWWGKRGYRSPQDLVCDFSTGRTPAWADPNNTATLGYQIS